MVQFFVIYLLPIFIGILYFLWLKNKSILKLLEVLLIVFFIASGLASLLGFMGHIFNADQVAAFIGWPAGNPFQFEIGIANLAMSVLAFACIWIRGNFWLATIMMKTIFDWGAAYGHIIQIIKYHNYHPGNAGLVLYTDMIVPAVLIILYILFRVYGKQENS